MITFIILIIILALIIVVPTTIFSATFVSPQEQVFLSLGEYEIVEYCEDGGWQDFTIYYEITYENPNLENNEYLKQLTQADIEELNLYLDNFEDWVGLVTDERDEPNEQFVKSYDFDRNIISINDYCYIYSNPDYNDKFDSYDVYFYDTETEILYYFHNNI